MQKDCCKPGTGNSVVGKGAVAAGRMHRQPASQGRTEGAFSFVGRREPGQKEVRSGTAFVFSLFGQGTYVGSGQGRVPVQVQSLVGRKGGMLDGVNQPLCSEGDGYK